VLLMVPSEGAGPWLAGGGSTVRGVADKDEDDKPLAPFVCTTFKSRSDKTKQHEGKKGTLAVMGDGKVRFIPETMSPDLFRALCTIAGGEKIEKLDAEAPEVEADTPVRELKAGGGLPDKGKEAKKDGPKEEVKAPDGWQVVKSKTGGFSVFMPGTDKPALVNNPGGETYLTQSDKGRVAFTVTQSEELRQAGAAEAAMTAIVQQTAEQVKGKAGPQSKVSFKGHAGKEFQILAAEGNQVLLRGRLFVVGSYLIALNCSGTIPDGDVSTFFGSLRQSEQAPAKDDPKKEEPKKGPSNNKGKLEGTKWSSKAFSIPGPNNTMVEVEAGMVTVEFKGDMSFTMDATLPSGKDNISGKYSFGPGDKVNLEPDKASKGTPKKLTVEVAVKGDEMTLSGLGTTSLAFVRRQ